ncbi:MAG: FGGY-family carbohydrate kinase [Candidatus Atribacteria bacterium]|nr:FGGY-family carbohydrate kinase [Candidatus Atribacteria bacterium]
MAKLIIVWDLGTGGNKASLYDGNGNCLVATLVPYDTFYPAHGWHEQKPNDWWDAVVCSTKQLLKVTGIDKNDIYCCGTSGHSLGAVPLDKNGNLLREQTPIWSDSRAVEQAQKFFEKYDEKKWYMTTGNGFTPPLYPLFKTLWYRDNEPDIFKEIDKVVGTKDYINFKLTGKVVTDFSYASGSGVYDLINWKYAEELVEASGLPSRIFPEIVKSTDIVSQITPAAAEELGLTTNVYVISGGVDNSCMALGAKAFKEGRVYNSLGSSSWIAVSSQKPLLDSKTRPFVFAHVVPEYFASALAIIASGSSFRWMRDHLTVDLQAEADAKGLDVYDLMAREASKSEVGAHKLVFNPSLGGGMPLDKSSNIRGAFIGLDLIHTRADLIRAAMEGISLGLRSCLDTLKDMTELSGEMLLVGGGSKSTLWRQIYADAYNMKVLKTNIDQQAAALGAAACAAVGTGLWGNFDPIDGLHILEQCVDPIPENVEKYRKLSKVFKMISESLSDIGDVLNDLEI